MASDIFGIHSSRHKEICDSLAEEAMEGWKLAILTKTLRATAIVIVTMGMVVVIVIARVKGIELVVALLIVINGHLGI